jgi:multicomponent Na+:H+ antiporter subunit A
MLVGPLVLAAVSLAAGLALNPLTTPLIGPAVAAITGSETAVKLALWHGLTPALGLSAASLAGAAGLFAGRRRLQALAGRPAWHLGPAAWYQASLAGLNAAARQITRWLQNGYLRYYLLTIVAATVALGGLSLVSRAGVHWPAATAEVGFLDLAVAVLILCSAAVAATSPSRLGAIAALGGAGFGVALIYATFGAPDLAMTQFLVEALTVVLFVLAFYHLPHFARLSPRRTRLRDAIIALAAGSLMSLLVMSAAGVQLAPSIAVYFAENSLPLAHGRNIVNVILVDFRGLDTLGEISVLAIAAIGVYALLKLRPRNA